MISKRLKILSSSEVEDLYSLPKLTPDDRNYYFTLDDQEKQAMLSRRTLESRIYFILQLGYFKCKTRFFNVTFKQVSEDVSHIINHYFPKASFPKENTNTKMQRRNQSDILRILNFNLFDDSEKQKLLQQARKLVKTNMDPRYVFDVLIHYMRSHKTSLPSYSTLQDIVGQSFTEEELRLGSIIEHHIPQYIDKKFRDLLEGDGEMYGVTIFKKEAKGFNYTEVKKEIDKKQSSEKIYDFAVKTIPKLKISDKNILYYASLVDYYTADRLCELPFNTVRVYLLCYVFYRFQKINDNLINSFVYYISTYQKQAKTAGKEKVYEHKFTTNSSLQKIGKILDLFVDNEIPDDTPFGTIKFKAFSIVAKDQFPLLNQRLRGDTFDESEFIWNYYSQISRLIS